MISSPETEIFRKKKINWISWWDPLRLMWQGAWLCECRPGEWGEGSVPLGQWDEYLAPEERMLGWPSGSWGGGHCLYLWEESLWEVEGLCLLSPQGPVMDEQSRNELRWGSNERGRAHSCWCTHHPVSARPRSSCTVTQICHWRHWGWDLIHLTIKSPAQMASLPVTFRGPLIQDKSGEDGAYSLWSLHAVVGLECPGVWVTLMKKGENWLPGFELDHQKHSPRSTWYWT